jgi:hypothetical protein
LTDGFAADVLLLVLSLDLPLASSTFGWERKKIQPINSLFSDKNSSIMIILFFNGGIYTTLYPYNHSQRLKYRNTDYKKCSTFLSFTTLSFAN